ncbi:hypothetical protein NQZ79_g5545 [Umbelopsis isabellina]|nr:hypothetical protein NQZ79_g5545 [Umbelopsis isabellina]
MDSPPEELKYLLPYLQRAQELQTREPIVAYYAKYYAAKLALSKGPKNKNTEKYILSLLDELEAAKAKIGVNEAITDDMVGYAHIENFGLKVFENADNEDRSGRASKKTAKTFLAASVFLELLKTFGDIDPDVAGKIKYAKWKAADIIKSIREGRTPVPGPPGGEEAEDTDMLGGQTDEQPSAPGSDPTTGAASQGGADPSKPFISQFPSPPSNFTTAIPPTSPRQDALPPTNPGGFSTPASGANQPPTQPPSGGNQYWQQPSNTTNTSDANTHTDIPPSRPSPSLPKASTFIPNVPRNTPSISNIPPPAGPPPASLGPTEVAQAQKFAKFAISALTYDDVKTARDNLLKALDMIGYNQSNNFGFE